MKTIITTDKANQPYGYPQLDANGNLGYKKYTALLTQSGGNDPQSQGSGAVTQGVTYFVDGADGDSDFSNVGGPIGGGGDGTYFIATNSNVPNNYGSAGLLYNNGAPVVTVLENTIGNVWWTYIGDGNYGANIINNAFTTDKTFVMIGSQDAAISGGPFWAQYSTEQGEGSILFQSLNPTLLTSEDNWFTRTPIEIRVYN
jgi:hypothetical protein